MVGVEPTWPCGHIILSDARIANSATSAYAYFIKKIEVFQEKREEKIDEATMGLAPMNNGFADRRVSYFTTWPIFN